MFDSIEEMLWVNLSGQLSTTQPLAHSRPPPVGWGKRRGRIKARKLGDEDTHKKIIIDLQVKDK